MEKTLNIPPPKNELLDVGEGRIMKESKSFDEYKMNCKICNKPASVTCIKCGLRRCSFCINVFGCIICICETLQEYNAKNQHWAMLFDFQ